MIALDLGSSVAVSRILPWLGVRGGCVRVNCHGLGWRAYVDVRAQLESVSRREAGGVRVQRGPSLPRNEIALSSGLRALPTASNVRDLILSKAPQMDDERAKAQQAEVGSGVAWRRQDRDDRQTGRRRAWGRARGKWGQKAKRRSSTQSPIEPRASKVQARTRSKRRRQAAAAGAPGVTDESKEARVWRSRKSGQGGAEDPRRTWYSACSSCIVRAASHTHSLRPC